MIFFKPFSPEISKRVFKYWASATLSCLPALSITDKDSVSPGNVNLSYTLFISSLIINLIISSFLSKFETWLALPSETFKLNSVNCSTASKLSGNNFFNFSLYIPFFLSRSLNISFVFCAAYFTNL